MLQREELASLESQRTDPFTLARIALAQATQPYPVGHPRYVAGLDEQIAQTKAVTVDDAKRFWVEFYGVGAGEAAFVGDFAPEDVTPILTELFGTWKSPAAYARVPSALPNRAPVTQQIETPDKASAVMLASTSFPLSDTDPAYPSMAMGNYIYGGSAFDSRLNARIRQKDGLSYGVGSGLRANSRDKVGQLFVYAIFAPENGAKVVSAFQQVTDSAVTGGFTPAEVAKGKAGYLQERQLARADDSDLSGQLADHLYLNRTMNWDAQLEEAIGALTPAQVSDGFRAFVIPAAISVITAGDFAKGRLPRRSRSG